MYYVYFYLREDGSPYYVGKGKGHRAFYRGKREISRPKEKSRIVFPHTNLDEWEAFYWEQFWINFYGRKDIDTGILRNRTSGGEGASGRIVGDNERAVKSAALKGKPGHKRSLESRQKQSASSRGRRVGEKSPRYGKPLSEETRAKMSEAKVGKPRSEEFRSKISEVMKQRTGEKNPNFGKTFSGEHRAKISAAKTGKSRRRVTCPHCGKEGGDANMKRYHLDNCKHKPLM